MLHRTDAIEDETIAMERGNSYSTCNNCGQNLFEIEQKVTNILRKVYLVCCATFVFCLVSLIACGCCIYLYTETARSHKEVNSLDQETYIDDGKDEDEYYYDFLTSDDSHAELYDENGTIPELQTDQHREKRKDKDESKNDRKKKDKSQNANQEKRRRGRGNKAMKYIKRLDKKLKTLQKTMERMKREVQSIRNTTKPPVQTTTMNPATVVKERAQKQNFIPHVAAAHYTSFVDNDYIKSEFPPIDPGHMELTPYNSQGKPSSQTGYSFKEHCKRSYRFKGTFCKNSMLYLDEACKNKPEWNGQLCRNRTLITSVAPTRLNVFKEAVWLKNISGQQVFDMRDGVFYAKHTGIYLVYAHVLFYDSRKTQAIELVHASGGKDSNKFRCVQNSDSDIPQPGFVRNTEYMSCSVNIVVYMEKRDTIEILNLFPNSSVDLSPDSTYFGGLVFVNIDD